MDSQQKGKLLKKREHVTNAGGFVKNENSKKKSESLGAKERKSGKAPLATAEADFEFEVRGLTIGDASPKRIGKSPISSPRRGGDRLTVQRDTDSGSDTGLRSPVMRSRSLPVREMSASADADKSLHVEENPFSTHHDTAAEVNQDWPLTGLGRQNLHPYRRYSLPITPVCTRGTEVFPGPRRNSLATTTLRNISRHYELFDTQKKIVEDEGEDGELTSPQGPFHLPSLLAQRREETVTPFGSL